MRPKPTMLICRARFVGCFLAFATACASDGKGNGGAGGNATSGSNGDATGGTSESNGGASGGALATPPCPANAVFCEDFEDGNLDGWTSRVTSGTLEISAAQVGSGKNALAVTIPAEQRGGFIEKTGAPLFPLPNNALWGRMLVYFDGVAPGHTDLVRGAASDGNTPWYNVGEQQGSVLLNYYSGAADCWARPSPSPRLPQRVWSCWEWAFDGATNEMQFYIDGQLSRQVSMTGDGCLSGEATVWQAPTFESLRIGAFIAQPGEIVMHVYIDDIAVGTEGRLGCPIR